MKVNFDFTITQRETIDFLSLFLTFLLIER